MLQRKRMLVVEDDNITSGLIKTRLEEHGFDVVIAETLMAGLRQLERGPPFDAILLDRNLPDGNGIDFLRKLKSNDAYRLTPVILETSMNNTGDIRDGLAAGAYYYLTKPLDPTMMIAVVNAAIEQHDEIVGGLNQARNAVSALGFLRSAEFEFRTLDDARALAMGLSLTCANPVVANFGLMELFVNAVEHGNLEISYQEKSILKLNNTWREEVDRRSLDPRLCDRVVNVKCEQKDGNLSFTIRDQGNGFDWQHYLALSPARACDPHGRGIALANMNSFDSLEYLGNGNTLIATLRVATD